MPGKSKHSRGKHPQHSRKNKIRQRQAVGTGVQQQAVGTDIPQQVAAGMAQPAAAPVRPGVAPKPKAASAATATVTIDSTYIVSELKRIGILTGILIIILIILSLVLK
jgi:hypothetical protein